MSEETEFFYPANPGEWRSWLEKNHDKKTSVWLVFYKKASAIPSITWSEAVDEALCFGWIDSKKKPIDFKTYKQFFSRRKTRGTWSKINKDKIKKLMDEGRMAEAGLVSIAAAKKNGSWTLLDETETLTIPKDLDKAFRIYPGSLQFFEGLSKSAKKIILQWVVLARRPETRAARIRRIAESAAVKQKPF